MHFIYVDESGDPGIHQYGSPFYILSGLVVPQDEWSKYLERLKTFRQSIKDTYGLQLREEIHAAELIRINKTISYRSIKKIDRISILKAYCQQIPIIFDTAKVINICLVKSNFSTPEEVQLTAWNRLIQRFDTFLKKSAKDKGIVISDETDGHKIMRLMRKMRVYNPVPSYFGSAYNAPTDNILEDLLQRNSQHSYFIQTVDVIAHILYRKECPKGSLKKYGLELLFDVLEPILLKEAAKGDKLGIVRK
ncbi:MAG: DUF3800 domain-containing protein [Saprospiraceae bacterium]|jgi:hypothetical protein|nr:DUF3800 domain-containing protein [Saprospiraceae bacterium]